MKRKTLTDLEIEQRKAELKDRMLNGESTTTIQNAWKGTRYATRRKVLLGEIRTLNNEMNVEFERRINKAKDIQSFNKSRIIKDYRKLSKLKSKTKANIMFGKFFRPDGSPVYQPTH